jgi:hypothetical protein
MNILRLQLTVMVTIYEKSKTLAGKRCIKMKLVNL